MVDYSNLAHDTHTAPQINRKPVSDCNRVRPVLRRRRAIIPSPGIPIVSGSLSMDGRIRERMVG